MITKYNRITSGRPSARGHRFALAQAAAALTPFWALTVNAALSQPTPDPTASEVHSFLNPLAQTAQSGDFDGLAAQHASGMASQQLQQWLQNFGTARVEFGINSKFAPQTGSVDLLLPLYDSPDRLFFTQNGIRLNDGQATGNFGLGQRHFIDDWMIGYNAFYDENFSQGHKRFGIGVETWRDYLKLSGNGYWRLSDWKKADNLTDYQARPANGFDVRAEGWLADYPSLSARLMYEQYFGSEVALFGKDKRQKNPQAITAGLSWTPVPLISLTADHKAGGNQNESLFGLQMNWQFGRSLDSQLDPDQVNLGATLAGNGMDLVNRNNNIVLEYRKQELIKLSLSAIDGAGTAVKPIDYQLDSKYGLKEIIWNDAAIVAAGGQILQEGNGRYTLALPPFKLGGNNSYTLSGVAVDQRGNRSAAATTTVVVGRTDVSAVNSRVVADDKTLVADGKSTTRIGIYLMDADNLPITGALKRLKVDVREDALPETGKAVTAQATVSPGATKPASVGDITEKGNGLYEATLTTGTRSSLAVITASLDDVRLPHASVQQIADEASANIGAGDLSLITNVVAANGKDRAQAQAKVVDANGNPVPGVEVTFTLDGSAQPAGNQVVKTNSKGIATLEFTNTAVEIVNVTAETGNSKRSVQAAFIADKATAQIVANSVTSNTSQIIADSSSTVIYTVEVKDALGHPVSGIDIVWSGNPTTATLKDQTRTGSDGKATVKMVSRKVGTVVIKASVNNNPDIAASPVTVNRFVIYGTGGNIGNPIDEKQMVELLEKSDSIYLHSRANQKINYVTIPPASNKNIGATVTVKNEGAKNLGTYVYSGGKEIGNLYKAERTYTSDGVNWK